MMIFTIKWHRKNRVVLPELAFATHGHHAREKPRLATDRHRVHVRRALQGENGSFDEFSFCVCFLIKPVLAK